MPICYKFYEIFRIIKAIITEAFLALSFCTSSHVNEKGIVGISKALSSSLPSDNVLRETYTIEEEPAEDPEEEFHTLLDWSTGSSLSSPGLCRSVIFLWLRWLWSSPSGALLYAAFHSTSPPECQHFALHPGPRYRGQMDNVMTECPQSLGATVSCG